MLSRFVEQSGRGFIRGLFLSGVILSFAACDKDKPAKPDVGKTVVDVGPPLDAAVAEDLGAPDLPPPPPQEFAPPWAELSPSWTDLKKSLGDTQIGKISGEAWGEERPVRAVVRSHCGSGALFQAVFESDKGLQVTPAMPVRFIGVATKKAITYSEGPFEVTVNFSADTPERLAGSMKITYEEHGQQKTFIDLTVDGKPLPMLLEPKLSGEGRLPEFQSCHPSGRFMAKTKDGRQAAGFVFAAASSDAKGVILTPLLSAQTGLKIVAYSEEPLKDPWTVNLAKDIEGSPVQVAITAFYTPELTTPETAQGPNLGSEQKVTVRHGLAVVEWTTKNKRPQVKLRLTDLRIPELIEGPLRGTTFEEIVIEAEGVPQGVYPDPPPATPLGE